VGEGFSREVSIELPQRKASGLALLRGSRSGDVRYLVQGKKKAGEGETSYREAEVVRASSKGVV